MRPLACRKSEMKLVDILESIDNLPQKMVPRSRVTVSLQYRNNLVDKVRSDNMSETHYMVNVPSRSS